MEEIEEPEVETEAHRCTDTTQKCTREEGEKEGCMMTFSERKEKGLTSWNAAERAPLKPLVLKKKEEGATLAASLGLRCGSVRVCLGE